jgi:SAM-dependent methyltransferase
VAAGRRVEPYTRLAGVYDEIVVDPCYPRWADHLDRLWRSDRAGVHRVLDVCCGTGRLAAELTDLGYEVVGVDSSPAMLARARRLLGPRATLLHRLLPDLDVPGTFDAAVSTFDSLNYLDPSALRATTVAVARVLRPDGWFVFDVHTDAQMRFTAENPAVAGTSEGYRFTITSEVDQDSRTCLTSIDLTREADGDAFSERHEQYFHSEQTLRGALARAGLTLMGRTDEYSDEPVGPQTLRATWTARLAGPVVVPRS